MTNDWLGINFDTAEEKTSNSNSFELLKEGLYKAVVKSIAVDTSNTPVMYVNFELEDSDKVFTGKYWLNDKETNKSNLKNLYSRCEFSGLTEKEYKTNNCITTSPKSKTQAESILLGKKVLVHLSQGFYFPKDKTTGEQKYLNLGLDITKMPKYLVDQIAKYEEYNQFKFEQHPVIYFNNEVRMYGIHFYNDFNPDAKFTNSIVYEYYQDAQKQEQNISNIIGDDEISF